jgi:single-stranded-DNA-specific exonuclease
VVGIVASRVVERYGRPAFLIALDGDVGKGSGHSISRFDLHAALTRCGDLLERYGGHHMAAGLTVRRDRVESFRARFAEVAREALAPDELGPEQRVDLVVGLEQVSSALEQLCRHLEPCGVGNPGPVFGVQGARFERARRVGANHLKGRLADGRGELDAIGFGWADRAPWIGPGTAPLVDVAFRLEENEYQGTVSLQARVVALAPAGQLEPVGGV